MKKMLRLKINYFKKKDLELFLCVAYINGFGNRSATKNLRKISLYFM